MQVKIGSNWRCSCLSKRCQFDYLRTRLYCRAKCYSTICRQGEENIPTNCQLDTHTVANIHDNSNKDNNISLLKTVVNISTLVTLQWKEKCLIHWQTVDVIIRTYNKVTKWHSDKRLMLLSARTTYHSNFQSSHFQPAKVLLSSMPHILWQDWNFVEGHLSFCWWGIHECDIGDGDICHRKGWYGLWIVEKASVIG